MIEKFSVVWRKTKAKPVTVMCRCGSLGFVLCVCTPHESFPEHSNGGGCSGLFICIHYQLDRIKLEGVVDFFSCIKLLRSQRPSLVACAVSESVCHGHCIALRKLYGCVCIEKWKMLIYSHNASGHIHELKLHPFMVLSI